MRTRVKHKLWILFFTLLLLQGHAWAESLVIDKVRDTIALKDLSGEWSIRDIDSEKWHPISVPQYLNFEGKWIYRHFFDLDSTFQAQSYDLYLQGIDGTFSVYVNDKFIGSRNGPSMPVSFIVNADYLRFGTSNELIIECDTRLQTTESLPVRTRYKGLPPRKGGIYRPVWLRAYSESLAKDIELDISDNQLENLSFVFPNTPAAFSVEIRDLTDTKVIWQESKRRLAAEDSLQNFSPGITLLPWTPFNPQQYRLFLRIFETDGRQVSASVDFSPHAPWRAGDWRSLSGQDQPLKMVEWTEDLTLRSLDPDSFYTLLENDVKMIKDLGCNAIRVLGDPPPDSLVSICSREGIMLLIELPIRYVPNDILNKANFRKLAVRAITDMIDVYREYPAVKAWGLGSGYFVDSESIEFVNYIKNNYNNLDDLPLYWVDPFFKTDSIASPVDFIISSSSDMTGNDQVLSRIQIPLPADGLNDIEREELQAMRLQDSLQHRDLSQEPGLLFAPLRDYRGDTPFLLWGPRPNTNVFRAGVLDVQSNQRPAYQVLKSWFTQRPMPRVLQDHEMNPPTLVFLLTALVIIVILLFMIKTDRRFSQYLQRMFIFSHGFYTDLTENRQVNKYLTIFAGFSSLATLTIIVASIIHYLHANWLFDYFLTWLFPSQAFKYKVIWIIWHPFALMGIILLSFLVFIALQVLFIKVLTLFQSRFIRVSQILTLFLWVPVNFYFLLPLALVIYRALDRPGFHMPMLIYIALILVWFIIRSFRGLLVLLQFSAWRLILLSILLLGLVSGFLFVLIQPQLYATGYLSYFVEVFYSMR
jgi:hypothetical protein